MTGGSTTDTPAETLISDEDTSTGVELLNGGAIYWSFGSPVQIGSVDVRVTHPDCTETPTTSIELSSVDMNGVSSPISSKSLS